MSADKPDTTPDSAPGPRPPAKTESNVNAHAHGTTSAMAHGKAGAPAPAHNVEKRAGADDSKKARKGLRAWLAHAFSLDPGWDLSPEDHDLLNRVAKKIVDRGLTGPVLLALQSFSPLGFLGSQAMIALQPFAELIIPAGEYERCTRILERREGLELLMRQIESLENQKKK